MATPVTLTLGAQFYVTKPEDRITKTFQHTVYAMPDELEILYPFVVSLPNMITQYGNDTAALVNEIKRQYQNLYSRLFPTANSVIVKATTTENDNWTYSLSISIQIVDQGVSYSISPRLKTVNGYLQTPNDVINLDVITNTLS